MRFGSLFSGIEAASAAWLPLGWECAWTAEIDPFACAVLRHHYPDTPNLGDVNRIDPDAVEPVDLVVFGSPCQDFSVAGKRKGMDGERGNLSLVALSLVAKLRPRWLVFENVPGLLSNWSGEAPSDLADGEEREGEQYSDFAAFLGAVRECGYLGGWRVYDAQFAGVPQRRRRVFFVGYLGDWRGPAAVLFEPESLRGDTPPRREAGQDAPAGARDGSAYNCRPNAHDAAWRGDGADNFVADIARCVATGSNAQRYDYETETLIAFSAKDHGADAGDTSPTTTLRAGGHSASHANAGVMPAVAFRTSPNCGAWETGDRTDALTQGTDQTSHLIAHTLRAAGFDAGEAGTGRGTPLIAVDWNNSAGGPNSEDTFMTLGSRREPAVMMAVPLAAFQSSQSGVRLGEQHATLDSNNGSRRHHGALQGMSVRRLTPGECLKLQGFPPDYLDIRYRGKPASDGPKYRATGNSMAVPVVAWLGRRIQQFTEQEAADAAE